MRVLLVIMALLIMAGFVYLNDYQHDMMMESVDSNQPNPKLEAAAAELGAVDTVFVLVTKESQEAFRQAVVDNPGGNLHDLGVSTEDRVHDIEVPSSDGQTTQTAPALIVFTSEEAIWNDVALRTDSPLYVLDRVRLSQDINHILLNPPSGITDDVPESIVLDQKEVTKLFWRLK